MTSITLTRTHTMLGIYTAIFVGSIVLANYLTNHFGFVYVAPGLQATAGTFAAGATFTVRDELQDLGGRSFIVLLIFIGALVSWAVTGSGRIPGSILPLAAASGIAFGFSEFADFMVYTPLKSRSWDAAVWISNLVGSTIDTIIFLWLAFGATALTTRAVSGQMVGKMEATLIVWFIVRKTRNP